MRGFAAALVAALLAGSQARAGILVEGHLEGVPVRLELGSDPGRVLATVDGRILLLDLPSGRIWPGNGVLPTSATDPLPGAPLRFETWGRGPAVAGYGSSYGVLRAGEAICAEVLASEWMKPFLEPVIRALALLQRLEAALRPKPRPGCGALPFAAYARAGWPLLAGFRDQPIFRTLQIRFDHRVEPARLLFPEESASAAGRP